MATFEARVEGLTGLSIDGSSAPTQDELTEYLKDGVIEVTERTLILRPQDSANFTARSATQSSNGANFNGTKIVSVIREAGANGDTDGSTAWRECRRIPPQSQSRVTDSTSLEYATKYNPVYTLDDSAKVYVYPTPDASDDGYQVYYINNTPQNSSGTSLVYSHSDLKHFPQDKYYLVVLYASCQSLLNKLSSYTISQTVPSLSLPSAPVPPSTPSFTTPTIGAITVASTTISNLGVPPTYTAPTVTVSTGGITTLTAIAENTIDDYDGNAIQFDKWFATAAHLIEDEEDIELANAQLQKIGRYIEAYSTEMQNKLNSFNAADKEYQGRLQEAIQQAQLDAQKASQQAQLDSADAQQEAALLLQKENQEYASKLQQYSSDLGKYSAEVQAKVQDHAAQINEISAEIQIDSTEYNWMSQRYGALKGQYDQAFGLMAPKEGKD